MSLEFYCRHTKTFKTNYLKKYWGSIVGGVLLSLEFYCQQPSERSYCW
jgi:hypothetical protein